LSIATSKVCDIDKEKMKSKLIFFNKTFSGKLITEIEQASE
jgi:hypothetical protein